MNELDREKKWGLSFPYLLRVLFMRRKIGKNYQTPGFGLAAQLFATVAKHVISQLGPGEGEKLLKGAIEEFGRERVEALLRANATATAPEILASLREAVLAFAADVPQYDDITMMILGYREPENPPAAFRKE